jgi:hypothetical protein
MEFQESFAEQIDHNALDGEVSSRKGGGRATPGRGTEKAWKRPKFEPRIDGFAAVKTMDTKTIGSRLSTGNLPNEETFKATCSTIYCRISTTATST